MNNLFINHPVFNGLNGKKRLSDIENVFKNHINYDLKKVSLTNYKKVFINSW